MDFTQAFERVRDLRTPQIDRLHDGLSISVLARLRKDAVGYCYDRTLCGQMGVDYSDISEDDIRRFTVLQGYITGVIS
jgi:hypothetical protein